MSVSKLFGENLREERIRQGLTMQMVAQACGTSSSYIALIENGQSLPERKVLSKIAYALHLRTIIVLNWYLVDLSEMLG